MTDTGQPHDALFKAVFGHAPRAAAQLRAVLPEALARRIDFSSLRLLPGSFVSERLRGTQSDLLFGARCGDRPLYLYVLFEHQSRTDPLMVLRLLGYVARILERHVETSRGRGPSLPLPLVLPVVLHHGTTPWRAATTMHELFGTNLAALPEVAPYVPGFAFLLDDLGAVSDDAIVERQLDDFTSLALWALRDARRPAQLLRSLARWAAVAGRLAEQNTAALELIFRYVLLVAPELELASILDTLRTYAPGTEEQMATIGERLIAQGRVEGEARGRVEGEARGRVEGVRRILSHQLERKFGALPEGARSRLESASEQELLAWSERLLVADSLAAALDG